MNVWPVSVPRVVRGVQFPALESRSSVLKRARAERALDCSLPPTTGGNPVPTSHSLQNPRVVGFVDYRSSAVGTSAILPQ